MRSSRRIAIAGVGAVALLGSYLAGLQLTGNFHEVVPGEFYRSAQPSAGDIAAYAREYGIRSVVNLRGEEDADWYRDELAASARAGIRHYDFRMAATGEMPTDRALQLIALFEGAPKPILVHCRSGADRTGLASVIYLQRLAGVDEDEAEGQLSIFYGHIGLPFLSPTFAMDDSWEKLETLFGLDS